MCCISSHSWIAIPGSIVCCDAFLSCACSDVFASCTKSKNEVHNRGQHNVQDVIVFALLLAAEFVGPTSSSCLLHWTVQARRLLL